MASVFKFIHASDFHLDQPITGLPEIPSHLSSTLASAPYMAVERIFDLAESQHVDFILLSGDLVDLNQCGPRAGAFLLRQFERMASAQGTRPGASPTHRAGARSARSIRDRAARSRP